MGLIETTRSRLITKLNRRQMRVSFLVYGLAILAFFSFMLPAVFRVSRENIENTSSIIAEDFYSMVEGFQTQLNTFQRTAEITRCLRDYIQRPNESTAAQIAIHAQSIRSTDAVILNVCVDDLNGRLISSMNYSEVDRAAILASLPGYAELTEGLRVSYISPILRGAYSDRNGEDMPYIIYARNLEVDGRRFTLSLFYNVTYFLSRMDFICLNRIDDYCLVSRSGEILWSSDLSLWETVEQMLLDLPRPPQHIARPNGYYTYTSLNELGIHLTTFVRYTTMFSDMLPSLILVFIVLLLLPVISTFGLKRVNRDVLRPLTELSEEVRSYSPGKESSLQLNTDDEISDLCQDFSRMMKKVNQQVEDIHRQERDNAITQYRLLATQIDPHFIYNTMSLINALAYRGDNQGVMKINTALIRLLRERLNTKATIMDTVRCELETLNEYLQIMSYRYNDDVNVHFDVDQDLMGSLIPKNLLQPLIENAFFHGLTDADGACKGNISVLIYEMSGQTVIEISDDGKGMPSEYVDRLNRGESNVSGDRNAHIGFENIRQRLQYIYQEDFELTVYSVEGRGTTITIVLPIRKA